jgi:hypothetical protein
MSISTDMIIDMVTKGRPEWKGVSHTFSLGEPIMLGEDEIGTNRHAFRAEVFEVTRVAFNEGGTTFEGRAWGHDVYKNGGSGPYRQTAIHPDLARTLFKTLTGGVA